MTLDEAIWKETALAESFRKRIESMETTDPKPLERMEEEHRQLAEWLRELKAIKSLFNVTEKLFKANFRDGLIDVVDGYEVLFSEHKQLREIFERSEADDE